MKPGAWRKQFQRGVALITAVLVVSLSVIAATAVLDAGHYAILRTATMQNTEAAWWYASGAEDWVRTMLVLDREENEHDSLDELWAKPQTFPIEQGVLQGELSDALGKFNLNNLGDFESSGADAQESCPPTVNADAAKSFGCQKKIFVNLIGEIAGASDLITDPDGLANAIHDWIDRDQEPLGNGKEDTDYQILDPAHLAANRPMASVTELRAVLCALYDCKRSPEIPKRIFELLRPHLTALPVDGVTPININTATPQLLTAVDPALSKIVELRQTDPIGPDGIDIKQAVEKEAGVNSNSLANHVFVPGTTLFQLRVTAVIGAVQDSAVESARVALYSLIFRPDDKGTPVVLYHSTDTE